MVKVTFRVHYRNGMLGVFADEGQTLELSEEVLKQVLEDVKNPRDALEIHQPRKGKGKAADSDEG